jgi:hypothetical protein
MVSRHICESRISSVVSPNSSKPKLSNFCAQNPLLIKIFKLAFFDSCNEQGGSHFFVVKILPARLIFVYIWLLWGKPGSLQKPVVHRISSVEGNLFIFGLVCYFCPGSQKINILTSQYKRISNEQAVSEVLQCFCIRISKVLWNEVYQTISGTKSEIRVSLQTCTQRPL